MLPIIMVRLAAPPKSRLTQAVLPISKLGLAVLPISRLGLQCYHRASWA